MTQPEKDPLTLITEFIAERLEAYQQRTYAHQALGFAVSAAAMEAKEGFTPVTEWEPWTPERVARARAGWRVLQHIASAWRTHPDHVALLWLHAHVVIPAEGPIGQAAAS